MKMKKNVFSLIGMSAVIMSCAFALTGCSSDDVATETDTTNDGASKEVKMIPFTAVIGEKGTSASSRALADNGDGKLTTTWEVNEEIAIVFGGAKFTAKVTEVADNGSATIVGEVADGTNNGQAVELIYPASAVTDAGAIKSDLLAEQDGTIATIAEKYDVAEATGELSVSSTSATLADQVDFTNKYAMCKFTFKDKSDNSGITGITSVVLKDNSDAVITTVTLSAAAAEVYVAMEPIASKTKIKFEVSTGSKNYEGSAYAQLDASMFYAVSLKLDKVASGDNAPAGAEAVDLGIVVNGKNIKWANMNIGATSEEEYGLMFAWGETTGYSSSDASDHTFNWTNYAYANGAENKLTKYCDNSSYGNDGYTDDKTVLELEDDAAAVNWGGAWRMPTQREWDELLYNTNQEWTTVNGIAGCKFTSTVSGYTDKSIFLPAAGWRYGMSLDYQGSSGYYWSSSEDTNYPYRVRYLYFYADYAGMEYAFRYSGYSVRAVCE